MCTVLLSVSRLVFLAEKRNILILLGELFTIIVKFKLSFHMLRSKTNLCLQKEWETGTVAIL